MKVTTFETCQNKYHKLFENKYAKFREKIIQNEANRQKYKPGAENLHFLVNWALVQESKGIY